MARFVLLALSASILAVATPARSEDGSGTTTEILAVGQHVQHHGWLTTRGPDDRGLYSASVYIGDLDAATAAGWSKMAWRVALGTQALCERSQALPVMAGYYNAEQRACWAETRSQAARQMELARDAASNGKRVAVIGF